jgi:hypothetical protein
MMLDPVLHTVQISSDEGLTWNPASGIPEGKIYKLVEHPFGHNMAFALGKDAEHWVTYNRGETWQSWEIGYEGRQASLGGDTLSFHAEKGGESLVGCPGDSPFAAASVF